MVAESTNTIAMEQLTIGNLRKVKTITNELEFERASSMYLKLRALSTKENSYQEEKEYLESLISQYEKKHWLENEDLSEDQIKESDTAESLVRSENEFYAKRREIIREKLKQVGLNQNDLARLLGHRKGYMSELINGLRPFSKEDIVVVNRLLKIKFEDLIPTFIKQTRAEHIRKTLKKMPKSRVKLTKKDFDLLDV